MAEWIDIERGVMRRVLQDAAVATMAVAKLNAYKFSELTLDWLWGYVSKTLEDTSETPSTAVIRSAIEELPEENQVPLLEELAEVLKTTPEDRPRATLAAMGKRARKAASLDAMETAASAFGRGDDDEGFIAIERGMAAAPSAKGGFRISPAMPKKFKRVVSAIRIPTGFYRLDNYVGGIQRGELGLVMGWTGVGKSAVGVNMGHAAVTNKNKVAHFDTENGENVIRARYYSRFTGIPYIPIEAQTLGIESERKLNAWLERNNDRINRHLRTVYLNYKESTLSDFEQAMAALIADGFDPDEVIFDSPDHLFIKGVSDDQARWEKYAELYEKLRGIAQRLNVGIWAMTQAGKEAEKRIATSGMTADSIQKPRAASIALSINNSYDKKTRKPIPGGRCLYVAKARNAPAQFIIGLQTDLARMKIKALPGIEEDMSTLFEPDEGGTGGGEVAVA